MAILTIAVAVGEAMLYGVLGTIIDWLSEKNPNSFLQEEYYSLVGLSIFILVLMPLLVIAHSLVMYQTLMGNLPMIIRWLAHRYLINQSYAFFQNEFSGRIATKVMQTALAVRETVMKTIDVLLFVSVYFVTTLYLIASADFRLCLPLFFWLCIYFCTLYFFIPRLKDISKRQADARSVMTGRIVDSYTNILTLKLFSHTHRDKPTASGRRARVPGAAPATPRAASTSATSASPLRFPWRGRWVPTSRLPPKPPRAGHPA